MKLKKTFGGHLRFFGIGGAPLAAEVEEFLKKAHFPYAIGYGLTGDSSSYCGLRSQSDLSAFHGSSAQGGRVAHCQS